jgi:glucose/mannose transport system substrate-binding protein
MIGSTCRRLIGHLPRSFALPARLGVLPLACALLSGCSESSGPPPRDLEIFSWWVSPGEKAAFDGLVASFQDRHPNVNVVRASPSSPVNAAEQIEARMTSGSPPDVFQSFGGQELLRWVLNNRNDDSASVLEPTSEIVEASGLLNELPNFARTALSYDATLYAVPLDIPRFNVLFYNKRVLTNNGLNPPTSLAELQQIAEVLKPKGIVPLALGASDGSIISQLLFDGVLIAQSGVVFRDSYLTGRESATDPRIAQAVTAVATLLGHSNENRNLLNWTAAARSVIDGSAAMTLVGDWAKAFFVSAGQVPDVDFGAIPFPGTGGVFVFAIDCFSTPRGAANPEAAADFLRFIASKEAADIFSAAMGTSPARTDADRLSLDPIARRTLQELSSSTLTRSRTALIANPDFVTELDLTLRTFSENGNQEAVLNMLRSRYDQL